MLRIPALCLAVLVLAAPPLRAWGRAGHAEVARIAVTGLTPAALAQVQTLLEDDRDALGAPSGRHTLPEIASWPDEIRDVAPKGSYRGWHTRANPVCAGTLGPCPDGHCVDELIEHFGQVLADPRQPARQRNEALKWVVHLVGDLHQPLHSGVAEDGGRTPVRTLQGRPLQGATLHSVWDSQLARIALKGWHGRIATGAPESAPRQWMLESRDLALRNVYQALPGFACGKPLPAALDLDDAYVEQAVPVIRLQMERAGQRLALALNRWLR